MYKTKHLSKIIKSSCVLTLLTIGLGAGIALVKNWQLRIETTKVQLIRGAEIVNMLVEQTLTDSENSLLTTKHHLENAQLKGEVSPKQANDILLVSKKEFNERKISNLLGSIVWIDANGQLVAHSDHVTVKATNFSDRFYFKDLRDHPDKQQSIGPLVVSRTTAEWVFHMAVPLYDKHGRFSGVIAQQLHEKDIVKELKKYINPTDISQILTHYNGSPVSFSYPLPEVLLENSSNSQSEQVHDVYKLNEVRGTVVWHEAKQKFTSDVLVGFAKSPIFGLVTIAKLPVDLLFKIFLLENIDIFVYLLIGVLIILGAFFQVHKMSIDLLSEQSKALHDPLTLLHNRRALDENYPLLQRESMRSQHPLSVLFIDIDYFRRFNEKYGHETGDLALIAVAHSLSLCCRRPMDLICRWGGEEFVAILPQTNICAAEKMALDMISAVQAIHLNLPDIDDANITVSIGCVTTIVNKSNQTDDLIDMADKAMQMAKARGRNQYAVFHLASPISSKQGAMLLSSI